MREKRQILVVEDDEIMQRALTVSLERAGFDVTAVSTVQETKTALDSGSFSVVITDIFLPDGDGMAVNSLVTENQPNTPILAMTGYGHTELGQRAKRLFGERLFEKPFKKKVLIGKVKALVENKELDSRYDYD